MQRNSRCGLVNAQHSSTDESMPNAHDSNWLFVAAPLLLLRRSTTTLPLPVMRRSERLERRRRRARRHAGRRCQGCKDADCVRPVVSHWGCERARPGQHHANALRRFGAEVLRRAADDADHQDQDQDPARRDARPGGFVHRIGRLFDRIF
jgi:hypothetical protein|eukprot:COSAG01_NODE_203_length_22128_cov_280.658359_8_plen_150_part_00